MLLPGLTSHVVQEELLKLNVPSFCSFLGRQHKTCSDLGVSGEDMRQQCHGSWLASWQDGKISCWQRM